MKREHRQIKKRERMENSREQGAKGENVQGARTPLTEPQIFMAKWGSLAPV